MRKFPTFLSIAAVAALALAGCATSSSGNVESDAAPAGEEVPDLVETPGQAPTPTGQKDMPAWAQEMHWLIYPDGMECAGTEGCPNDYVLAFGQPGPVLPDNVERYDPKKHDCTFVVPAGADCFG
ncbi:MAG: hypothetical protein ACTH2J_03695 [Candidatus Microbacterium stercoravium]